MDREKVSLDMLRTMGIQSIWVVNDTLNRYENTYARIVLLKEKEMIAEEEMKIGDIPANNVKHISYPPMSDKGMKLDITEKGIYTIETKLMDDKDEVISKNSYTIEVV